MLSLRLLAQGLSVVLHPLAIPTYLVTLLAYALPNNVLTLATTARGPLVAWVGLLTFGLPALGTLLLLRAGRISSVELGERRQRPLPLALAGIGFLATTLVLALVPRFHDILLLQLLGGITLALLLTLLITFWWKISAHGVGMGGALGLVLLLRWEAHTQQVHITLWALGTMILAGAVAWARLRLGAHTPAQVAAGLLLGMTAALLGRCLL